MNEEQEAALRRIRELAQEFRLGVIMNSKRRLRRLPVRQFDAQVPHEYQQTIAQARAKISAGKREGIRCPCCGQTIRQYRRQLHRRIVEVLIEMYVARRQRWVHLPSLPRHSNDVYFARFFGLIEQREDGHGGHVSGVWRLTPLGISFLKGEATVDRYAHVCLNKLEHMSGPQWSVYQAFGERFNIDDI